MPPRRRAVTRRRGAIDAELALDSTAAGQQHAATARALRPTAEAKAEAWSQLVEHDELPNALQTATIVGFMDPYHRELLEPYVDRYFDSIGQVWETRTSEMATNIAIGLYPTLFVTSPSWTAPTPSSPKSPQPSSPASWPKAAPESNAP